MTEQELALLIREIIQTLQLQFHLSEEAATYIANAAADKRPRPEPMRRHEFLRLCGRS